MRVELFVIRHSARRYRQHRGNQNFCPTEVNELYCFYDKAERKLDIEQFRRNSPLTVKSDESQS